METNILNLFNNDTTSKENLVLLKHEQKSFVPFNGSFSASASGAADLKKIHLLKKQNINAGAFVNNNSNGYDFLSSRECSYFSNLVYSINSTERLLPTALHNLSIVVNFSKIRRYRKQFMTYIIFNRKRNLIIRKKRNMVVNNFRRVRLRPNGFEKNAIPY